MSRAPAGKTAGIRKEFFMRITITGKNIEISDYLKELAEKKVVKLDKYFKDTADVNVSMAVEHNRHIVEVTIRDDGHIIRGEEVTGDMYASIDSVLKKLERQIIKHRTKLEKQLKAGAFKQQKPVFVDNYEEELTDEHKIVKTKRFLLKPMSVDEAVMQLELLGHSFYMFLNSASGQINVLYLRKDGDYGLIEPE